MLRNEKGVTLVALAIITIVLIILAAVTLSMVIRGGVMDGNAGQVSIAEIEGKMNTAFSAASAKYVDEGYQVQENEQENTEERAALEKALYIYNDINSGSTFKNALPEGYQVTSSKIDGTKINLEVSVNTVAHAVSYDALTGKIVVSQ